MWGDFTVFYRIRDQKRLACVSVSKEFEDIEQAKIDIMLQWTDPDIECWKVRFDCIWYFKK